MYFSPSIKCSQNCHFNLKILMFRIRALYQHNYWSVGFVINYNNDVVFLSRSFYDVPTVYHFLLFLDTRFIIFSWKKLDQRENSLIIQFASIMVIRFYSATCIQERPSIVVKWNQLVFLGEIWVCSALRKTWPPLQFLSAQFSTVWK